MTIRHLRIFKLVCETGSFTLAAKKLYMTQPAVSHAISELEEELGTKLFDRISKKIWLNQIGAVFLEQVSRTLELYDGLEAGETIEQKAAIRLGSNITIANFWLPRALKEFDNRWPDTPVITTVDKASEILGRLLNHQLDLALIEGAIEEEGVEAIPFSSYRISAACAPGYLPREHGEMTLEELTKQKLLLRERGSAIRDVFDSLLRLHGLSAAPHYTSVNSQALLQATREGLGITILPELLMRDDFQCQNLMEITVTGIQLENVNQIVYSKGKYLSRPMKGLIEIINSIDKPGGKTDDKRDCKPQKYQKI